MIPISVSRRKKLIFSYMWDWLLTITLAVLFITLDKIDGFRRDFSISDLSQVFKYSILNLSYWAYQYQTSLHHPFAVHERIPNVALYLLCFVTPLLLQPVVNLFTVRSWWDLHTSTLGLIFSLTATGLITEIVKLTSGRPRPDMIDRCQPSFDAVNPPFGLSNSTICTQTVLLRDGFRSFPSGHSSLSFAGLGFFAFYLGGKLQLFDKRGHLVKVWLCIAPLSAASIISISRTMDYRHHWQDVFAGFILGISVAYLSYRQYYPHLASDMSYHPHSPRIARKPENLPTHASGQRHQMVSSHTLDLNSRGDVELEARAVLLDHGSLVEEV